MNNQSKKLQNLRESNDAIFQELFGFGKKEQQGPIYNDDVIVIDSAHRIFFPQTNSTILKPLPNYGVWTEIKWESPEFNWLVDADFKANAIQINGQGGSRKIEQVQDCIWNDGDFRGTQFIRGDFNGGTFVGIFGPGAKWNTSPFSFIDGTTKEVETILGIPNITNLNKNRFQFNVIAVVPGNNIKITLQNGVVHNVGVIKRLDGISSVFSYVVTNGVSKEKRTVNIRWAQVRGQNSTEFKSNTVFATNAIPDIFTKFFSLPFDSPIKSVEVDSSTSFEQPKWADREETPADLSKKQVSYELANLAFLGMQKIPRRGGSETSLYFNFPTPQDQSGYNSVLDALNKGWIKAYLTKVKTAIDNKMIAGAPTNLPFLAALIGKDDNINVQTLDKDTYNALVGIDGFLKYFVNNLVRRVRKTGAEKGLYDVEDTIGKEMIKNQLKSLIGVNKGLDNQEVPVQKTTKPKTGGAARKIKFAESSDVRSIIKDILSENLKHF